MLVLLDRHSECMCHCVDTGKAQNTLAAGVAAKKNLTVRIDSQNTQSAAVAARYRRTCVCTMRCQSEMPRHVISPI